VSLERQLATYGQHLRQTIAHLEVPVKAGVAVRPVRPATAPTGGRFDMGKTATWVTGRRGPLIAVAALVAALAVALPLWFVFRGEESPPVATEPTTTIPTTTTTTTMTTTIVPQIVGVSIPPERAPSAFGSLLAAVSAGEVWSAPSDYEVDLIGHLEDGVWAYWRFDTDALSIIRGLAVAPDGTVWAATQSGVFSFDGVEWTRRFDDLTGGVAVDEGGTVWAVGPVGHGLSGMWLAWGDGESWQRVDTPRGAGGTPGVDIAVMPDGEVWFTTTSVFGVTGPLMRYDGATLEEVEVEGYPFSRGDSYAWAVEAAPDGDLWVGGYLGPNPCAFPSGEEPRSGPLLLARFDGESWTLYDWPLPNTLPQDCNGLDIAVGPDGVVWLAYLLGLGSFDGTEGTIHLEGRYVQGVDVAPDGTVWYTDRDGRLHTLTP